MDKEIINGILFISKRIRPARRALNLLREVTLITELITIDDPGTLELKKVEEKLERIILKGKKVILSQYKKLSGYRESFIDVEYISKIDEESRYIEVSNRESVYLDITTGEFVYIDEKNAKELK